MKYLLILFLIVTSCTQMAVEPLNTPEIEKLMLTGIELADKNQLDQAAANFETAYELGAGAIALDALGCVAYKTGNLSEAETLFRRAISESPKMSLAYTHLGYILELMGKKELAFNQYQLAIEAEPKNYLARNNLAGLVFDQHKNTNLLMAIDRSKRELNKALVLKEDPIISENLNLLNSFNTTRSSP